MRRLLSGRALPAVAVALLAALAAGSSLLASSSGGGAKRTLRGGWYLWDPYQYIETSSGVPHLTGIDVELARAICDGAGIVLELDEVGWKQHQEEIRSGQRDVAAGTYETRERSEYAWFSDPYRTETNVLMTRVGRVRTLKADSARELLGRLSEQRLRVGVVAGYYYGPELVAWRADPRNNALVVEAENDYDNLVQLMQGRIDALIVDRLVGATMAWRRGLQSSLEHHPVPVFTGELAFMFSKRTVSPAQVEAFNESLHRLQSSGAYNEVVRQYLFPVLLAITLHQPWFLAIDLVGTVVFAISGVLLARKERYDIFGAFVLAALPAVGGGVVRDVLTDRNPLGIMRDPHYLIIVIGVVGLGTVFYKVWDRVEARRPEQAEAWRRRVPHHFGWNLVQVCDALGLALFTIVGVVVAIEARCQPLWLWGPLLATVTGAGGGILRDVVRADSHNPSLKGSIYPEIALGWGLVFTGFLLWETPRLHLGEVLAGVVVTLAGALLTRFLVLRFGAQSLFLYDARRRAPMVALTQIEGIQLAWLASLVDLLAGVPEQWRHEPGLDLEARLNRCATLGAQAQLRLTRFGAGRVSDEEAERHAVIQARQWRVAALQDDLRELAERVADPARTGDVAALGTVFAEATDALLHLTLDAMRSRTEADIAVVLQATGGQGAALTDVRDRYAESLPRVSAENLRLALHLVGVFERIVGHLRAIGQTLS